jgi:hypothetical protein
MGPESAPDNLPLPSAGVEYEYGYNFTSPYARSARKNTPLPLTVSKRRYVTLYKFRVTD